MLIYTKSEQNFPLAFYYYLVNFIVCYYVIECSNSIISQIMAQLLLLLHLL